MFRRSCQTCTNFQNCGREIIKNCENILSKMALLYDSAKNESALSTDISSMRASYKSLNDTLNENEIIKNPFKLFKEWFDVACQCSQIEEPNAMCLATCTKSGFPSARYVLLKHFDHNGFTFFTNYRSRKGKELEMCRRPKCGMDRFTSTTAPTQSYQIFGFTLGTQEENPNAAVVFYWEPLRRSIRIEGTVSKIPEKLSDEYFHSRPKDSQIGACVSNQSSAIENRQVLENKLAMLKKKYENETVPRPQYWGGFLIEPITFEFWQGQSNRLHDRFVFRKADKHSSKEDGWTFERLAP